MKLTALLARYSAAGIVNSLVSYALIFGCTFLGAEATTSNIVGYAAGLVVAYFQSRYWVFRSENHMLLEGMRFFVCFLVAFAINFGVLKYSLACELNVYLAQLLACIAYALVGFVLNFTYVFAKQNRTIK